MLTNSHDVAAQSRSKAPFYRAFGDEVDVFRAAARRGLPVLLKGPTGCGKTRFVEAMAHELGRGLITVAGHEDMTSADLVGRFLLKGGETVWVDGPLTRAVRDGAICYLDEVVEARQDTIVVIHPLTDHRRELPIDRLGTTLPAAPGFQLVISYNPGYQSVLKNIKESTRQRFVAIELDFLPADTETEVVAHEAGIDARDCACSGHARQRHQEPGWLTTARSVLHPDVDPRRRPRRGRTQPAQRRPVGHRPSPLRRSGCRPRPRRTRRCRPPPHVTASDPENPDRFRLLATFIAGRSVDIAEAPAGEPAHTNGQVVFVSAGRSVVEQRREMLVQSALLGAGSLDQRLVKALRGRPTVTRRYLALEGRRVLAELAEMVPLAAALVSDGEPATATAEQSLEMARARTTVAEPPEWFGAIRPSRLLAPAAGPGARATTTTCAYSSMPLTNPRPTTTETRSRAGKARYSNCSRRRSSTLRPSRTSSESSSATRGRRVTTHPAASCRLAPFGGRSSRRKCAALPTRIHFTDDGKPGAAIGVGGTLQPEWDVHNDRYRPEWCRVIDFPLTVSADISAAGVPRDDALRRRLSRIGLGPRIFRGRLDGDELDTDALIDLFVDLRSGHSPPEHVYLESRKLARNLGILILLDSSGSATDTDPDGLAVHDHQRRAAATLAVTLEELGDRVAVYAFRSQGRHAVHLPAIKTFGQRFGAVARARLNQLQPSGYTRLGAGIRGAGEILKNEAGTPNRLLVVLSDGFPYDDGYEGRYAEADARRRSRSSARTALPAFAFPSAPPLPPMRSTASSAPPAMPALQPWPI